MMTLYCDLNICSAVSWNKVTLSSGRHNLKYKLNILSDTSVGIVVENGAPQPLVSLLWTCSMTSEQKRTPHLSVVVATKTHFEKPSLFCWRAPTRSFGHLRVHNCSPVSSTVERAHVL
uniref:Uncharacterized protein n=1 Tax=Anguilla anguilla TaxID=7936 RepID=A0A0E9TS35_ANGAN